MKKKDGKKGKSIALPAKGARAEYAQVSASQDGGKKGKQG